MDFRKKPVVIEAFRMTKERRLDSTEWPHWLKTAWRKNLPETGALFCAPDGCVEGEEATPLFIRTLEGTMKVDWDDWIIQGVEGELYACKPGIFAKTYEPA